MHDARVAVITDAQPDTRRWLAVPLASMWLLMFVTFSLPGREGPESVGGLDVIAVAKLLSRLIVCGGSTITLVALWNHPRRAEVLRCFLPFAVFASWGVLSVLWSPLPAVSLGQCLGLVTQVMLAAMFALTWSDSRDTSRILFHLTLVLLLIAVTISVVDLFISHDLSGLNRTDWSDLEGANGLVHPTAAGATASLGLVLAVATWQLWGWSWTRPLFPIGVFVHSLLGILAASRTGLFLSVFLVSGMAVFFTGPILLAIGMLAGSVLVTLYLVADPKLSILFTALNTIESFAQRGESADQIATFTGRTDLWYEVLRQVSRSPIIGHGYFVTSENGLLDVWSGPSNRTAHNIVLQVLVSTGIIGVALFVWALGRPFVTIARGFKGADSDRNLGLLLIVVASWYAVWGQMSESFTGPISPESVFFFTMMGLGVGHGLVNAPAMATESAATARPRPMREAESFR